MSLGLFAASCCFALALIPAMVFAMNLRSFHRLPKVIERSDQRPMQISVLIPARNEASSIARAVKSVLSSRGVELELIVLDDHSTDDTAAIVSAIATTDDRVRVIAAPPLPSGWCGKQHACQVLAEHARYETMVWLDADVQLASDAMEVMASELDRNPAALISGFPLQQTQTWLEQLLIPLVHFILLGFLPLQQMRRSLSPPLGAGCGQLFMADRKNYLEAGGHAAIRESLHDGIALPRAFRRAGQSTDLFDASDLAMCRMYDSAGAVWRGLLKNAGEGIATPAGIFPWTILLFGGQVLPVMLVIYFITSRRFESLPTLLAASSCALAIAMRLISAMRFYPGNFTPGKYLSAFAHSLGVLIFLLIQWQSFFNRLAGRQSTWKGRSYSMRQTDTIGKRC